MSPAILAVLLAIAADPSTQSAPDTIVVCPAAFRAAMQPWLDLRAAEGHRIEVISNLGSAEEIRDQIRQGIEGGKLRSVLLVGGADPALYRDAAVRARSVPMHYAKARVNVLWGSTPTIPTDNWYVQAAAASDENPVPSVAIGRLPAESPQELAAIVKKIVAYEQSNDFGPWRQRMNFVAGVGNFGPLADSVLESAARMFLTQTIPAEYQVSMTYSNWHSPFCPDPRQFHATALRRLDEGSLFWVYIGHSAIEETAWMEAPGGQYPILQSSDAAMLRGAEGRPIAMFLACYVGAIDAYRGCLAQSLLAAPGGPVAVIAGTRVTMPYAMSVMATNLTDELFRGNCETVGEAMLHAKQRMLKEPEKGDSRRAMLDAVAAAISPAGNQLAAERADHVLMFHLLGDPLLRLRHPQSVALSIARNVATGGSLLIEGTSPIDGNATVDLVLRRDRIRGKRPARDTYPKSDKDLSDFQQVYQLANDRRVKSIALAVHQGHFRTTIDVPDEAAGDCHVCVFVAGKTGMATGSADIRVVRPKMAGNGVAVVQ